MYRSQLCGIRASFLSPPSSAPPSLSRLDPVGRREKKATINAGMEGEGADEGDTTTGCLWLLFLWWLLRGKRQNDDRITRERGKPFSFAESGGIKSKARNGKGKVFFLTSSPVALAVFPVQRLYRRQ